MLPEIVTPIKNKVVFREVLYLMKILEKNIPYKLTFISTSNGTCAIVKPDYVPVITASSLIQLRDKLFIYINNL